jgi:hypothetical protein
MKFNIGDKVGDKLTTFSGVVVGRAEYLSGEVQYQVQPDCEQNGKPVDPTWLVEQRLARRNPKPAGGFRP